MKHDTSLKRKFNAFIRICKYGAKNLFRNAWLSVAAIAVMFVALSIILATVVLNITANNAIKELSKNIKVSIYLKDEITDNERKTLETEIKRQDYVAGTQYISKDDARFKFLTSFEKDQKLLEGLTLIGGDVLPSSIEVSVTNLDRLKDVEAVAKQEKFKDNIDSISLGKTDTRKTIDRAAYTQKLITSSSVVAAIIFTTISALIIFNTIRIAIFTRSEEIRSMKLIGATPAFIRGPFLVESALYGIISTFFAVGAVYGIIVTLGSKISSQAEFSLTYEFLLEPTTIAGGFFSTMLVGILIGIISSALAMEKYLRLKKW